MANTQPKPSAVKDGSGYRPAIQYPTALLALSTVHRTAREARQEAARQLSDNPEAF